MLIQFSKLECPQEPSLMTLKIMNGMTRVKIRNNGCKTKRDAWSTLRSTNSPHTQHSIFMSEAIHDGKNKKCLLIIMTHV